MGHQMFETAYDGLNIGGAINNVLVSCGFAAMPNYPTDAGITFVPGVPDTNKNYRWAPKEGDTGDQIIRKLLLLIHRQNYQYRTRYSFIDQRWYIDLLRKNEGPDGSGGTTLSTRWIFSPFTDDHDPANARGNGYIVCYGAVPSPSFESFPPEANIVWMEGREGAGHKDSSFRVLSPPIVNQASLSDPSSIDYLGMAVEAKMVVDPVDDQGLVNQFARILFELIGHNRRTFSLPVHKFVGYILPNHQCRVWDHTRSVIVDGWIKKRTLIVTDNFNEELKFDLDTIWEGEVDAV
jgi:hypothetical protein